MTQANGVVNNERVKTVTQLNELGRRLNTLNQSLIRILPNNTREWAGSELDSRRKIAQECGWPANPTLQDFSELYETYGLAKRVVDLSDESWSVYPEVYETEDEDKVTEFEQAYIDLDERVLTHAYLQKADALSGIGGFGALLIGFDDDKDLDQPVVTLNNDGTRRANSTSGRQVTFLRAFDETCLGIHSRVTDWRNARYGQPEYYNVALALPSESEHGGLGLGPDWQDVAVANPHAQNTPTKVHWTRVLHVCDNPRYGELSAVPRMKPVLPFILDLRKVLGGSGEMFWQGAMPGLSIETFPEVTADDPEFDLETVKQQMVNYMNRLQRWIALQGMTAKSLAPQVVSPEPQVTQQLLALCASLGVPVRVFTGSEAAHLASTQDIGRWNGRVGRRQTQYIVPRMIKPFVRRLQLVEALPPVKRVLTLWVDLNALSDKDKADVSLKKTQAVAQFVTSGAETICPELEFWTTIMGLTNKHARAIVTAKKSKATTDVWKAKPGANAAASKNGLGA